MTPEQFRRVESLFGQAIELPAAERPDFLQRHCADDDAILEKVEGMLREDDSQGHSLESPALGATFCVSDLDAIETALMQELARVSHIHVLEKLGEGGFGAVYKARQLHPVRRLVALKVIKLGMDTQQVVARFAAERQALAMMDHPAIAKVYEAGATPSGRPYFAMELVEGVAITRYCDEHRMTIPARLELFVRVCHAVQHAHQKGIIHRDLKPSNVLVGEQDGQATPKVIDFGIARAVGDAVHSGGVVTIQGQPLGTPTYMSPEQAAGEPDIDTRTDVYSLGVLLYELLTGEPTLKPHTTQQATPAEVVLRVRELQAERPSQRAEEIARRNPGAANAAQRGTAPAALTRTLRGDLDWIVMAAIEHDRARRYETVAAFAEDIGRHLADEPIRAHPPTAGYRLAKFARRNRATLVVVLLIVAALVGTSIGLVRSIASEARARTDAQIAQEINAFLNNDLLAAVAPEALGSDVRVRDVLNAASLRVEGKFADQPEVEASVRLTLGRTFYRLAEFEPAKRHLERALTLRQQAYGDGDARTLEVFHDMGELITLTEEYATAEALLSRAFAGRKKVLGVDHAATLLSEYALGVAIGEQGRFAETEALITDALQRCRATLGPTDKQTLTTLRGLAVLYRSTGDFAKAMPLYEEVYALSRESLGVNSPNTLLTMQDLAGSLLARGDAKRALDLMIEAVAVSKSVRGDKHPGTLMAMGMLASAYQAADDVPRAEQVNLAAIEVARDVLPAGHAVTIRLSMMLAAIYDDTRQFDKAEPLLLTAVATSRGRLGEGNPLTQEALRRLASHYRAMGKSKEAAEVLKRQ